MCLVLYDKAEVTLFVCCCRHCAKGVVMEIRRPVAPPTVDNRGTPRLYAVSDDVMYSSSDDDDADDSSLNLSSLNDDVDFD